MAFHRQAKEYDRHASVQKRVISRLSQLVKSHLAREPESVLDIGCGTGLLLSSLKHNYPDLHLNGLDLAFNMTCRSRDRLGPAATVVQADAESLPFPDGSMNLILSTSTLQWVVDLEKTLHECNRVMSDESLLCIAFFGGNTLWELRKCYLDAVQSFSDNSDGLRDRLHAFKNRTLVQQVLERIEFDSVMLMSEIEIEYHPDLNNLLRTIKNIGAGAQKKSSRGLGWRRVLNETSSLYQERFQKEGVIPATYEVLYVIARKSCK